MNRTNAVLFEAVMDTMVKVEAFMETKTACPRIHEGTSLIQEFGN